MNNVCTYDSGVIKCIFIVMYNNLNQSKQGFYLYTIKKKSFSWNVDDLCLVVKLKCHLKSD